MSYIWGYRSWVKIDKDSWSKEEIYKDYFSTQKKKGRERERLFLCHLDYARNTMHIVTGGTTPSYRNKIFFFEEILGIKITSLLSVNLYSSSILLLHIFLMFLHNNYHHVSIRKVQSTFAKVRIVLNLIYFRIVWVSNRK